MAFGCYWVGTESLFLISDFNFKVGELKQIITVSSVL